MVLLPEASFLLRPRWWAWIDQNGSFHRTAEVTPATFFVNPWWCFHIYKTHWHLSDTNLGRKILKFARLYLYEQNIWWVLNKWRPLVSPDSSKVAEFILSKTGAREQDTRPTCVHQKWFAMLTVPTPWLHDVLTWSLVWRHSVQSGGRCWETVRDGRWGPGALCFWLQTVTTPLGFSQIVLFRTLQMLTTTTLCQFSLRSNNKKLSFGFWQTRFPQPQHYWHLGLVILVGEAVLCIIGLVIGSLVSTTRCQQHPPKLRQPNILLGSAKHPGEGGSGAKLPWLTTRDRHLTVRNYFVVTRKLWEYPSFWSFLGNRFLVGKGWTKGKGDRGWYLNAFNSSPPSSFLSFAPLSVH